ncbi:MAG TPA: hypothetical protein VEC11_07670 [Allosphingosinicella sp.]|nr:hypothetical protein [Allosphingosinicella sp.]
MTQRWLILYRTSKGPAAKIVDDRECRFPFGVHEDMVSDDCDRIIAMVDLPANYMPHAVAIDDREIEVQRPEVTA